MNMIMIDLYNECNSSLSEKANGDIVELCTDDINSHTIS